MADLSEYTATEIEAMTPGKSWLWPDRTIGKRESRTLREEHNALVNSEAELLRALERCADWFAGGGDEPDVDELRAAIAKATGAQS
jgi:hypothetical protein